MDGDGDNYGEDGYEEGYPEEEHVAAREVVEVDADGGGDGHGEVVAEPVEADAFVATLSGEDVYGAGAVGDGDGSEGGTMEGATYGKHEDGAGCDVAGEENGEGAETDHQDCLAGEAVDDVTTEGTDDEGGYGVAAQHDAYRVFGGTECVAEI